jgi:hypothetical protein
VQAVQFNKLLSGDETFKDSKTDFGDGKFDMRYANFTLKVYLHLVTMQQLYSFLKMYVVIAYGENTDEQLYNCDKNSTVLKTASK